MYLGCNQPGDTRNFIMPCICIRSINERAWSTAPYLPAGQGLNTWCAKVHSITHNLLGILLVGMHYSVVSSEKISKHIEKYTTTKIYLLYIYK